LESRNKTKASSTFRHESGQHSGKQSNRAQRAEKTLFSRIGLAKTSNGLDQPNPSEIKDLYFLRSPYLYHDIKTPGSQIEPDIADFRSRMDSIFFCFYAKQRFKCSEIFKPFNCFRNAKTFRGESIGINYSANKMIFYGFKPRIRDNLFYRHLTILSTWVRNFFH
jgi:hypothetical protein